jgi:hypothetical protein
MQNKSAIKALFNHWKAQRFLQSGNGLSSSEISSFEERNGICIPSDFSQYLRLANGFKPPLNEPGLEAADDKGFEFYPLTEEHLLSPRYWVFCGWPVGFIEYAICVDKSEKNGEVVKVIDKSRGHFLAKDFSHFVGLYLSDSQLLYAAGSEVRALS